MDRLRRHPVITATFVACILAGVAAAVIWLPDDWTLARRLAAGAVAGAGTALFITATRLFD